VRAARDQMIGAPCRARSSRDSRSSPGRASPGSLKVATRRVALRWNTASKRRRGTDQRRSPALNRDQPQPSRGGIGVLAENRPDGLRELSRCSTASASARRRRWSSEAVSSSEQRARQLLNPTTPDRRQPPTSVEYFDCLRTGTHSGTYSPAPPHRQSGSGARGGLASSGAGSGLS